MLMIRNYLLVGLAYYIGAYLGANYTIMASGIVIFWPPNAVLLTAFLLSPGRSWPGFSLAVLIAEVVVDTPAFPLWAGLSFGFINIGECALAAFILRRAVPTPFSFDRLSNVGYFFLAAPLFASAVAALFGALVYIGLNRDGTGYWTLWRLWWFGDAMGLLLLTPLFLTVVQFLRAGVPRPDWWLVAELLALWALTLLAIPLIFSDQAASLHGFYFTPMILLPVLFWAAIRFGIAGTTLTMALIAIAVTWRVTQGAGLYGATEPEFISWLAQETLAILAVFSIGLAVFLNELTFRNHVLEQRVQERTASLALANQALNKANEQLQVLASKDYLLGISNRREFSDLADRQMSRLRGEGKSATLIMFDLDRFKRVNDRYGHDAGDCLLQSLVAPVTQALRPLDLFARYGGEEFVVLLPDVGLTDALAIAERLREQIENLVIEHNGHQIRVTCSFGIAQWDGQESLSSLVSRTDKALYQAKQTGRNKVCFVSGDVSQAGGSDL